VRARLARLLLLGLHYICAALERIILFSYPTLRWLQIGGAARRGAARRW